MSEAVGTAIAIALVVGGVYFFNRSPTAAVSNPTLPGPQPAPPGAQVTLVEVVHPGWGIGGFYQ